MGWVKPLIVMGDFNAKVGDEIYEDTVGPHGLGNRNERGEKLIEWAKSHKHLVRAAPKETVDLEESW